MARRSADEIIKALQALPRAVHDAVDPAVDKGANEIAERVRYLAPEDEGKLKRSVHVVKTARPLARRVIVDDEVGLYQEYGTATNDRHPFFWISVNTRKEKVQRRISRAITKGMKEAFK